MIVQGANFLSNHQGQAAKASKANDEKMGFEDILMSAHKKKEFNARADKKEPQKKQTSQNDVNDDQQAPVKHEVRPMKSEKNESSTQQTSAVNDQNERTPVKEQNAENMPIANKKFENVMENKTEAADSINLSGMENNTLGKNIEISEKVKNAEVPFREMMEQMQEHVQEQNGLQNSVTPKQGLGQAMMNQKPALGGGSMKIEPEMKMSQTGETLELGFNMDQTVKGGVEAKSGEAGSQDQPLDLEAMINQAIEQDSGKQEVDSSNFAQELKLGQESSSSEKIENMQSIIKQARAIVDDGGGSMEIHLQPEGLGKVHLKVAVNDGQVNVEMMADNVAAKKALEENLMDIKHALEGQKLLVETLKVEMSQDYQKDFSDLQQHMQEQANRDFAEQFLDQFQRDRQEKFGGMFDSFRSFQPGRKEPELTLARRNPYAEAGKGRTVNLVA